MISVNLKKDGRLNVPLPQNPKRAYKRGYEDGFGDSINSTMKIVVWTLVDNDLLTEEQIHYFAKRFESVLDMIESGNIKVSDIERTLKKEYDWEVEYH